MNALALAALNVWRRPLPQVLKETIMDPIGASDTWRWFGYENSFVVLDGAIVQSVSGGGHWGGGLFINAYDMGRFGYLTLRRGKWKDRQLISDALGRDGANADAGRADLRLHELVPQHRQRLLPSAPASAFVHIGNGANMIYVDPDHDMVAVVRWIDGSAMDGFVKRLIAATEAM